MPDVDDIALDDRLRDLAHQVARSGHTPPYEQVTARARSRRRTQAVTAVGLAAVVVLAVGFAVRPGQETAVPPVQDPRPTGTAVPPAVDGQVTDVVELPGGGLALLYGQCPPKTDLCAPHLYRSLDGGQTWTTSYVSDGGPQRVRIDVQGPARFDVSAAGDVALLNDQPPDPAASTDDHRVGGLLMLADDPNLALGLVDESAADAGDADLTDPRHAIPVTRGSGNGFDVVLGPLRHPLAVSTMVDLGGTLTFAAAEDGVLTAEADDEDLASRDLGLSWTPVPDAPHTELTDRVVLLGQDGLVRFGYGAFDEAHELYPLTTVQVLAGGAEDWVTHRVSRAGGGAAPLVSAVPVGDGTFAAVDTNGALYRSDDGTVFRRDPAGDLETVSRLGGHLGQAWALTTDGSLLLRTAADDGAWRSITLPE